MLDVITDFWKPARKSTPESKIDLGSLQIGSVIGFGFVPQSILSGRRYTVNGINTYQFGDERLTSFLLEHNGDSISMIVADADGEKYLALSRRIPQNERARMFDADEMDAILFKPDVKRLQSKDLEPAWKQWIVGAYKKEIHELKGKLIRGDYRSFNTLPDDLEARPFDYTLLVSENNEYAIEAEKYADGQLEFYATIYRRLSDIGEVRPPAGAEKLPEIPSLSLSATSEEIPPQTPLSQMVITKVSENEAEPAPAAASEPPAEKPAEETPLSITNTTTSTTKENDSMAIFNPATSAVNGVAQPAAADISGTRSSGVSVQPSIPNAGVKQELKAISSQNGEAENDAIECDLRVANKIIEEAIRNEMRLSDIVRRIIALPVAYPESVQIPVTLSDADFQLLAIRYGVPAADRNSIKTKIIDEINDFSGGKKQ